MDTPYNGLSNSLTIPKISMTDSFGILDIKLNASFVSSSDLNATAYAVSYYHLRTRKTIFPFALIF